MAHKVILPPKKNYIPQFLKQRDINSYYASVLLAAEPKVHLISEHEYTKEYLCKTFKIYPFDLQYFLACMNYACSNIQTLIPIRI
jgi:hypothetical protein